MSHLVHKRRRASTPREHQPANRDADGASFVNECCGHRLRELRRDSQRAVVDPLQTLASTPVRPAGGSGGGGYRSAVTDRFVKATTAKRHPSNTVSEGK